MKRLAVLLLLGLLLALTGCAAPEGGSSLPWTQPEPWESKIDVGVDY